jgi:hypothetical protein
MLDNPDRPTRNMRRRNQRLVEMLLACGDIETVRQILAGYPYLRAEYSDRLARRSRELMQARVRQREMA